MTFHLPDSSGSDRRSGRWTELLAELARRASETVTRVPIPSLVGFFEAASGVPRVGALEGGRLERELGRVRSREEARLLAGAAELALASTLEGRLCTAARIPPPDPSEWIRRCAALIDKALLDDADVDGELIACGLLAVRHWPPASVLAKSACRLDDSPANRLVLARAHLAEGRHDLARGLLVGLESARLPLISRAQLREAQGLSCEQVGDSLRALRHYERAAALAAGARPSVAALVIALELGLGDRAAWALEAIESAEPDVARLAPLLREVIARRELLGRPVDRLAAARATDSLQRGGRDLTGGRCR